MAVVVKLELDRVHEYEKVPGTQTMRLVRTNPATRICVQGQSPIYVQHGVLFYEGGERVPTPAPAWFVEEVKKLSSQEYANTGLPDLKALEGKDGHR